MKGIIKKTLIVALSVTLACLIFGNTDAYAKSKVKHNVTYIYGAKSVTVQVAHGKNAPVPTDTAVPGFKFVSWVGSAANVTEDRVILGAYVKDPVAAVVTATPAYPLNAYTGGFRSGKIVNNNKSAPFPEWWNTINLPKGVPGKTCAVYWYNGHNGELWKTDIVPYGASLPTPADPCLDGYQFMGWEGDWTNVTEDRAIRAWYFTNHTIRFECDECEQLIDIKHVHDGEGTWAEPHHHDGKEFVKYVTSDGWTYEGGGLTKDLTLHAIYKDEEKK
ncbi:MAG: hypothetical protein K6F87_06270 [Lachnospiraceae bacterium]|nr:hypothetical protein [Lachnospiraceae bacterium]